MAAFFFVNAQCFLSGGRLQKAETLRLELSPSHLGCRSLGYSEARLELNALLRYWTFGRRNTWQHIRSELFLLIVVILALVLGRSHGSLNGHAARLLPRLCRDESDCTEARVFVSSDTWHED
jgi:hypothetical protein